MLPNIVFVSIPSKPASMANHTSPSSIHSCAGVNGYYAGDPSAKIAGTNKLALEQFVTVGQAFEFKGEHSLVVSGLVSRGESGKLHFKGRVQTNAGLMEFNAAAKLGEGIRASGGFASGGFSPCFVQFAGPADRTLPQKHANRRSYMLEFSGRQTHVVIPKLHYDGSYPITLEATVMSLYRGSIIGDFNGSGLGLDVANGFCSFHVNDGRSTNSGYASIKSTTSIGRDKLVHIAGVFDGRELRLYVAGKLQSSDTIGKFNKSTLPFMIGADPDSNAEPTQFLNGFIDKVRISKTARYDADFAPPSKFDPDKHTLLLYRFDEGEGDVANDASGNGLDGKIYSPKWVMAPTTVESSAIQRLRQIGVKITEKNGVATDFAFGNSAKITDADLAALDALGSLETLTNVFC